ncbi:OmpH family outer membrane protein [Stakelama marina]|uniref:OmpH family outer membrane protein n=1 Tax=Stakelama marina TaxID=2826939 RepID=A0A8T4I993_9SPHN|nr:OmpH family outer membrane protein [Stakelama marina]MBR0551578.1 OmpH family outer membrane protein [Stakelama marina]
MALNKTLLFAAAALAPIAAAAPAQAQVAGVAVADPQQAIQDSNAWKTASAQIQTTYKAQIDQAQSRSNAIKAELDPLVKSFNAARQQPNANQASLQTQAQSIQSKEQAANAEVNKILQPVQRARAYALEQISNQYPKAVQAVIGAKKIQVLLRPDATIYAAPAADVTSDITAQLNTLVSNVSIQPPANWQPGQQQNAPAAPAAQQAPATGR